MRSDSSIDEESLRGYADWLAGQGVRGLAVNVDTGEGPHLFPEERLRVLQIVAEQVGGRALVIAGLAASANHWTRRFPPRTTVRWLRRPVFRSSPSSSSPRWAG